jgi:hypothetical protein
MMAQSMPKPALRPFLPADIPMLAAIFVAAIQEMTGDDYSEAQQEAWAAVAEDEAAFGKKLASELTLIATIQNAPVGFASLKGNDHIDMLCATRSKGWQARVTPRTCRSTPATMPWISSESGAMSRASATASP